MGEIYATIYGLPTSHVHGAVTAISLIPSPLPFSPRMPHALRRVGGRRGGHGNECQGIMPGAMDRRKRSVLISCAVSEVEELD